MGASRPRNRKQQIAQAAERLFCEFGYHGVGVDTVAAEVGIGGSALYRHFRDKQDLLAAVVFDGLAELHRVLDQAAADAADASEVLSALVDISIDKRGVAVLWQRESRHMRAEEQIEVSDQARMVVERVAKALAFPEPADALAQMRARAVLSVLWSPAYHHATPPRREFEQLLTKLAWAVWRAPLAKSSAPIARQRVVGRTSRASRRELILAVASRQFAERGFAEVSVDDVAAAVGVTGTSVYRHFASKADLLHTALTRAAEALHLSLSGALTSAATAAEALDLALASYVDVMLEHRDITQLLISEVMNLPDETAAPIRRTQRAYVSEWVHLVRESHPTLTAAAARVVVHAALGVINHALRTHRQGAPSTLRPPTLALGLAVLHSIDEPGTDSPTSDHQGNEAVAQP